MPKEMRFLPICPDKFPNALMRPARLLAKAWAESSLRPHPTEQNLKCWDTLVDTWIKAVDLPLLIRKSGNPHGSLIIHDSGRQLIPTDNSPAHWSFMKALLGIKIELGDVRKAFAHDNIPVAMVFKKPEKLIASYRCDLSSSDFIALNKNGWKIAHIERIGLRKKDDLKTISIDKLINHFRKFLSPSNMFLVPKIWAGLGELPEMAEAIKKGNS